MWALGMSEESVWWDGNLMPVDVGNYVPTVLTVTEKLFTLVNKISLLVSA